ncbi:hypothetical protein ACM25N_06955 [Roseovarius sp. C7]|uniref:hypothetical protein n=1 Tax=Roseovarius sp. C7 TaxID=3398643 RepID=UPI0039F70029
MPRKVRAVFTRRRAVAPRDDRQPAWLRPVAYVGLALLLAVWPMFLVLILALAVWSFVMFVALVGKGSFHEAFGRLYRWLKARRPDRAETLRQRMDRLAERVDGWLDRLPNSWAERLALPDFSASALDPDDTGDLPDPFERLVRDPA